MLDACLEPPERVSGTAFSPSASALADEFATQPPLKEPARPQELEEPSEPSCFPSIEIDGLQSAEASLVAARYSPQPQQLPRLSTWSQASVAPSQSFAQSEYSLTRSSKRLGTGASTETCEQVVKRATSFAHPSLRRGMPVTTLLSNFGQILRSSAGSELTFEMSEPVLRLHCFVSHNWSVGRVPKFLALAFYFNLHLALLVCFLCSGATGALIATGYLGTRPGDLRGWPVYYVCCGVSVTSFLTALLFGHRLQAWLCRRRGRVFLDKTCIHQTDAVMQRKGIESLAAHLLVSDRMLIIYTDVYLQKLWTVYELASMLCLHQKPRIKVVPTDLVKYFFVQFAAMTVMTVGVIFMYESSETSVGMAAQMVRGGTLFLIDLLLLPGLVVLRAWARKRAAITRVVEKFEIRKAKCLMETDRELVYRNVSALMQDTGYVPRDATEDAALDAFDAMVRSLIPDYVQVSLGRLGLPYRVAFACNFPVVWAFGLDLACADLEIGTPKTLIGGSPAAIVATFLFWVTTTAFVFPLSLALGMWLDSKFVQLPRRGLLERLYGLLVWFASSSSLALLMVSLIVLWGWAVEHRSVATVGLHAGYCCLLGAFTCWVFRPYRLQERQWHEMKEAIKRSSWSSAQSCALQGGK